MAQLELTAKHSPLAWLLYFTKLRVVIDGDEHVRPWGKQVFELPPGSHTVEISFGYLGSQRGPATTTVEVSDHSPARLRYRMPPWMFAAGRLDPG